MTIMKKTITIIYTVIACLSISAQDITPLDKIFDEISAITSVPRSDVKQKINHGDGIVTSIDHRFNF